MRQVSHGIKIVSVPRKMIFDIQLNPYRPKWQTKRSKLAHKDIETSEFHQDTWNHYLMLGFLSAHIPWNAISHLKLRRSHKELHEYLVLTFATILSNIIHSEYALTVDAIKKQLPLWNKVSLAYDGWTSTTKLARMSAIAYYMDRNWALHDVQLAFDEVDRLFCSHFKS